jgi:hypothetical protein
MRRVLLVVVETLMLMGDVGDVGDGGRGTAEIVGRSRSPKLARTGAHAPTNSNPPPVISPLAHMEEIALQRRAAKCRPRAPRSLKFRRFPHLDIVDAIKYTNTDTAPVHSSHLCTHL